MSAGSGGHLKGRVQEAGAVAGLAGLELRNKAVCSQPDGPEKLNLRLRLKNGGNPGQTIHTQYRKILHKIKEAHCRLPAAGSTGPHWCTEMATWCRTDMDIKAGGSGREKR